MKNWSPGDNIWFEKTPIGHNLLNTRFKKMCGEAGLVGNFTNHSGRATAITRMYDYLRKVSCREVDIDPLKGSGHIREKIQITSLPCRMFCCVQRADWLVALIRL